MDPDGPHGVAVAPSGEWRVASGEFYFVSTAHGNPFGSLWKFRASTNEPVGRVELGNFPATVPVSPKKTQVGGFALDPRVPLARSHRM